MRSEGTYQFERSDLETILFADNAIVRSRFQESFADLIRQFLDESDRVCAQLRSFGSVLTADLRAAWVEKFVFSAFNSLFVSCHLLISGLLLPAGNLMRQYAEASAMALLCSHHAIDVLRRFDKDPTKFPVHDAVRLVRNRRNTELLRINAQGWTSFEAISKWYDQYSHVTVLSLTTDTLLQKPGSVILGGKFDDGKCEAYRKELGLRVSAMARLCELVVAVRENVKAAQANGLFVTRTSAS
ncbi:MAG: hypothetical protein BVN28_04920 [Nitrospira sp. ST-bin4]|jgi:hypothetical protein|nr:MAG: hypothetical protein BVN28_04920 [Nitrospira sp. ST-bin4]